MTTILFYDTIVVLGMKKEIIMTKKTPEQRMQEALDYIKEKAGIQDEE